MARLINQAEVLNLVLDTRRILEEQEKAHEITTKGRGDFVTAVDFAIQQKLKGELTSRYPEIQFLGEEGEREATDWSRPVWILDPVDGTLNLIYGRGESCVSLGLWDGEKMLFGCCYNPFREELYRAYYGEGAYLNNKQLHVTDVDTVHDSLLMTGTAPYYKDRSSEVFDTMKRLFDASLDIRRSGTAAGDLCTVACGRSEGYYEINLKAWDCAAGTLLVTEAGGKVTDLKGEAIFPGEFMNVVASNGHIHEELLALIADRK